jgi:hypothetical protein
MPAMSFGVVISDLIMANRVTIDYRKRAQTNRAGKLKG